MDKYWSDAPPWAKYVVINYNYRIGYHELKPYIDNHHVWVSNGKWQAGEMFNYAKSLAKIQEV